MYIYPYQIIIKKFLKEGARERAQWQRAFVDLTENLSSDAAPTVGDSQQPVTPAPGMGHPLQILGTSMHVCAHM